MLTFRERKGFNFERLIDEKLRRNSIAHQWRPYSKGSDFKIGDIELEAKFSHTKIFPCWIRRDWVTRFSEGCKAKVVVTNRGMKLPKKSLEILKEQRIMVVFFDRLILTLQAILSGLNYIEGNHLLNNNHSLNTRVTIIEYIKRITREKRSLGYLNREKKSVEGNQFSRILAKFKKKWLFEGLLELIKNDTRFNFLRLLVPSNNKEMIVMDIERRKEETDTKT